MARLGSRRRTGGPWGWIVGAAIVLALCIGLGLGCAPQVFPYLTRGPLHLHLMPPSVAGFDARPGPALGQVVGGRWRVQQIAADTYALGEPADEPDNYEYLLVGQTRALLIDSGATERDIRPVLAGLTKLPIVVTPTHLHYDHSTGLAHFDHIALIDLPETRGRVKKDGKVHLSFREYQAPMGTAPAFAVSEWVKPGGRIDLGGRVVTLLSTPGHTATSVSISDPAHRLLFTGDLIYTTSLYAFMPDSSLSAYASTLGDLLHLPADTRVYGAHCCRNDVVAQAPWLAMQDLADARAAVQAIRTGKAKGEGLLLRRFAVNSRMTLITFYPFGNH